MRKTGVRRRIDVLLNYWEVFLFSLVEEKLKLKRDMNLNLEFRKKVCSSTKSTANDQNYDLIQKYNLHRMLLETHYNCLIHVKRGKCVERWVKWELNCGTANCEPL